MNFFAEGELGNNYSLGCLTLIYDSAQGCLLYLAYRTYEISSIAVNLISSR